MFLFTKWDEYLNLILPKISSCLSPCLNIRMVVESLGPLTALGGGQFASGGSDGLFGGAAPGAARAPFNYRQPFGAGQWHRRGWAAAA